MRNSSSVMVDWPSEKTIVSAFDSHRLPCSSAKLSLMSGYKNTLHCVMVYKLGYQTIVSKVNSHQILHTSGFIQN